MTITLYKNSAEFAEVDKSASLTTVGEYTGKFTGTAIDIEEPTVRVLYKPSAQSEIVFPDFNYAYIAELKRYYYRTGCEWVGGFEWEISLSEDYIMSHKAGILAKSAVISRLEDVGHHTYVVDSLIIAEPEREMDVDEWQVPAKTTHKFNVESLTNDTCYIFSAQTGAGRNTRLFGMKFAKGFITYPLDPQFSENVFNYYVNLPVGDNDIIFTVEAQRNLDVIEVYINGSLAWRGTGSGNITYNRVSDGDVIRVELVTPLASTTYVVTVNGYEEP